jgi:hypothetical protein
MKVLTSIMPARGCGERREGTFAKDPHGIAPADQLDLPCLEADHLKGAKLGEAGLHGDVAGPEHPLRADGRERGVKHPAVDAAAGEVDDHVRNVGDRCERMRPVPAATDVRQDDGEPRMAGRQLREVDAVTGLLRRPVLAAMLPRMVQHRQPMLRRELRDGIEQRVAGAAARQQLDPDRPPGDAPLDLRDGVRGVVGIHRRVHPHPLGLCVTQGQHRIVAERHVVGRREVGGRPVAVGAEHRGDVHGDAHLVAGAEPRGIQRRPVGAARVAMPEMRVHVDQHRAAWRSGRRFLVRPHQQPRARR